MSRRWPRAFPIRAASISSPRSPDWGRAWDPWAQGAIFGLTRGTTTAHLAHRGGVHGVPDARPDPGHGAGRRLATGGTQGRRRRVGKRSPAAVPSGPAAGRGPSTGRHRNHGACGAAYLAGLAVGYWRGLDEIARNWRLDREFTPRADAERCEVAYHGWQEAVRRTRGWDRPSGPGER